MICNLNTIDTCQSSVPGLISATFYPFGSLKNLKYDSNMNLITGYDYTVRGVEYNCANNASFTETLNKSLINTYEQTLVLLFSHISHEKRNEILKMANQGYTIVLRDKNNHSWLFGYDYPVRLTQKLTQTGTSSGDNLYNLTFKTTSKTMIKEIVTIDSHCSSSVTGQLIYQSLFILPNDFIAAGTGIQLQGGNTTRTIVLPVDIQPQLWSSSPTQYSDDMALLNQLLNPNGNSEISLAHFDDNNWELYLAFASSDTPYISISIDGGVTLSEVKVQLNLKTVVNAMALNMIDIELQDQSGTIFELPYGEALMDNYTGLSGRSNDVYIDLSLLYAGSQTFFINVKNNIGTCSVQQFEYEYISYMNCLTTVNSYIARSNEYVVYVDKFRQNNAFRRTKFVVGNFTGTVFNTIADWSSSFANFESEVTALLASSNAGFTSYSLRDLGNAWEMRFTHPDENLNPYVVTYTDDSSTIGTSKSGSRVFPFQNKKLFVLEISGPADASVSIQAAGIIGTINGYLQPNSSLSFSGEFERVDLQDGTSNTSASKVSFYLSDIVEDAEFVVNILSMSCPSASMNIQVVTCLDLVKYDSFNTQHWITVLTPVSQQLGSSITINMQDGSSYILPFGQVIDQHSLHILSQSLNSLPLIKCINVDYDAVGRFYTLTLLTPYNNEINTISFNQGNGGIRIEKYKEYIAKTLPLQHPNITLSLHGFSGPSGLSVHRKSTSEHRLEYNYTASSKMLRLRVGNGLSSTAVNYRINFWNAASGAPGSIEATTTVSLADVSIDLNTILSTAQFSTVKYIEFCIDGLMAFIFLPFNAASTANLNGNTIYTERGLSYGELQHLTIIDTPHTPLDYNRSSMLCPNADYDAISYLSLVNETSPSKRAAVIDFVTGLKSNGLWSYMQGIYLFFGDTIEKRCINLKNQIERDFAFHLTANGNISLFDSGVIIQGNSGFFNTHFTPLFPNTNNFCATIKLLGNNSNLRYDFGALTTLNGTVDTIGTALQARSTNGNLILTHCNSVLNQNGTTPSTLGLYHLSRTSSTEYIARKNGVQNINTSASITGNLNYNPELYIGCSNVDGLPSIPSNRQIAYFSFGNGLSASQLATYDTLLNTFLTAINR